MSGLPAEVCKHPRDNFSSNNTRLITCVSPGKVRPVSFLKVGVIMKLTNRTAFAFALAAAAASAGALVAACSSSSSGSNNFSGNDASTVGTQACPNPTVPIIFSPMYSAYIPGDQQLQFEIPAITGDGNTATWSLSDSSQGQLQPQAFDGNPGVMITISGSGNSQGQVTVIATESGGACGTAVLTITQNAENDWTIGKARYNDGVSLTLGAPGGYDGGHGGFGDGGFPEGGFGDGGFPHFDGGGGGGGFHTSDGGSFFEEDGGTACTNCHGSTAQNNIGFNDVQHTPEQTGGFSNEDLQNIILNGQVPDGGYFNPSVLDGLNREGPCDDAGTFVSPNWPACAQRAYEIWQSFHKWTDIDPQTQLPGVICYLRALAPQAQTGTSNFGGHRGHDGGAGGGGGGTTTPDGG